MAPGSGVCGERLPSSNPHANTDCSAGCHYAAGLWPQSHSPAEQAIIGLSLGSATVCLWFAGFQVADSCSSEKGQLPSSAGDTRQQCAPCERLPSSHSHASTRLLTWLSPCSWPVTAVAPSCTAGNLRAGLRQHCSLHCGLQALLLQRQGCQLVSQPIQCCRGTTHALSICWHCRAVLKGMSLLCFITKVTAPALHAKS